MSRALARLAKPATFPIVGIGASAGGLDASQTFVGSKEILVKVRTVKRQAEFSVSDTVARSLPLRTPTTARKTRP